MRRFSVFVALLIAVSSGTPVEREDGPMVVDVPAGMFDYSEASDVAPVGDAELPLANEKDVERVEPTLDSVETDEKKPDTDDLGFRIPTIFVIRRPVLSDRFPFFQQSPFQSFRPFSFLGNRRPSVERPVVEDVADDENTHDMLSHMEQMMKRMQQQMSSLWGSFASPSFHRRPLRPIFPFLESEEEKNNNNDTTVINIDNLPANYSNSTSETKVVDGHVVQVNKTIHKISSGDNNSGFFHFEVINVRPTEGAKTDSTDGIPDASETKPVEVTSEEPKVPTSEDPSLNEVGGISDDKSEEGKTFPYWVNRRRYGENDYDEFGSSPEAEWIPRTEYQRPGPFTGIRSRARSLSDDLRVNRVVQDQKILSPYLILNPDVELFHV